MGLCKLPEFIGSVRLKAKNFEGPGVAGDDVVDGFPLRPDAFVKLAKLDLEKLDRQDRRVGDLPTGTKI